MPSIQIENRIAGYLPRPVISNIPSPIDMKIGNAQLLQVLFRHQQVRFFSAFTQGQHRIVLTKKQRIGTLLTRSLCP